MFEISYYATLYFNLLCSQYVCHALLTNLHFMGKYIQAAEAQTLNSCLLKYTLQKRMALYTLLKQSAG